MKTIMTLLGYLTGKTKVQCQHCQNLKDGKCFGVAIPKNEQTTDRACGFYKKA